MINVASIPKGIRVIIIASVAVWILQLLPGIGSFVNAWCNLSPFKTFGEGQIWRLFTYMFLHDPSAPFHLLFNLLTLWMFGVELEELWGTRRFIAVYLLSGIGAGLFSIITIVNATMWFTPVIGASGAILALLTIYALYFPTRQILLFFLVPVNVLVAVAIFGAVSLFGSMNSSGNISHLTHLGGILVGVLYVKGWPIIAAFFAKAQYKAQKIKAETETKKRNEQQNYYEHVVDPILKKISENGISSLTKDEKNILDEASKKKQKSDENQGKILKFKRK